MDIIRGKIQKATKTVIYGPEGIGKSTLASRFPDPVFIDTEGSTGRMDVARFPAPTSWAMLLQEVQEVIRNPSLCRTLIIDTADWAEKLCTEALCAERNVSGIEDFGYGKGYTYLKESFGKLLNLLSEVIDKGVNVVITAHAIMRKFEQPDEMGAYDRWELKLSKQCAPLIKEWADMILFCNYKTIVVNVDNKGAQKGTNKAQGGKRVMYTAHHPCWDAKNRDGLPEELPMDYESIRHVIEASAVNTEKAHPVDDLKKEALPVSEKHEPETMTAPKEPEQISFTDMAEPKLESQGEMLDKKEKEEIPPGNEVSPYFSDPERIPKALRDLMEANNVSEWNIQDAVAGKGYYPEGTLIQDMDPAFVQGVLVGAWDQVFAMIQEIQKNQGIPFE
ncbi:hypothetical protein GCWU000341_02312 [Oribacterium sp. oral taxon 078 str. F0262]|uniref:ATP-binding protein n=1 Tax=Oribacterium sp. oral taxon 078 TaxID=652706 RepID=UPI0001BCBE73|nr:ATP-binding protein [Oribacterium sp. oral taxon 078]EFE91204.1 hypothetical protein GCWU000341_02312 [Oribacterium sp. oral taxon 078 str. F0262]